MTASEKQPSLMQLGTTPVSSIPYVYSLGLTLTMGVITIIMHVVFVLLQTASDVDR